MTKEQDSKKYLGALERSSAFSAFKKLAEQQAGLQKSFAVGAALEESSAFSAMKRLVEQQAALQKSFAVGAALEGSSAFSVMKRLAEQQAAFQKSFAAGSALEGSSALSVVRKLAEQQAAFLKSFGVGNELLTSSAISEFSRLKSSPFDGVNIYNVIGDMGISRVLLNEDSAAEESEILLEIKASKDFNFLSDKSKIAISYVYHFYILPILLSFIFWQMTDSNARAAREQFFGLNSSREVKSVVRSSNGFDRSFLKGYRVTVGDKLNLRDGPGFKSNVIAEVPLGTVLEVVDKSNRSWLLVDVEIDGQLVRGWVLRRYTLSFK